MSEADEIEAQTPGEFLWLILIPLVLGIAFFATFATLRRLKRYEKIIYAPRLFLDENEDGTGDKQGIRYLSPGFLGWISEVLRYGYLDVLRTRGPDEATYLMVMIMMIKLTLIFSFFSWVILVPVYMTSGGNLDPSMDVWFNTFSLSRVQTKSARLWAPVVLCYFFSFVSFGFLLDLTKRVVKIRVDSLMSESSGSKAYSVLVTDVPDSYPQVPMDNKEPGSAKKFNVSESSKSAVGHFKASLSRNKTLVKDDIFRFFDAEFPGQIDHIACMPSNVKELEKLWLRYQKNLGKLERAKADYEISDGQGFLLLKKNAPKLDPTNPKQAKKLAIIKEKYLHYMEKTSQMKCELEKLQAEVSAQPVSAAIVTFTSRRASAIASQCLHSSDGNLWLTSAAEEPAAMIWTNLSRRESYRYRMVIVVVVLLILLVFFWMIPVFFVSSLTTLSTLEKWLPFVKDIPEWLRSFLQGFLPGLALLIFNMLLVPICRFLTFMEGVPTLYQLDSGTATKLFVFDVFNTFLGVTVMASILEDLESIVDGSLNFFDIITLLGEAVPSTAIFFLNYILIQCWAGWPEDIARVVDIVIYHIKVRFLCRTDDDIKMTVAADGPRYPRAITKILFIFLVSFVFSTIHPIVPPFAFVGLLVGYFVQIHNYLFVTSKNAYESGGMLWWPIFQKICWILVVAQLTLAGVLLLKESPIAAAVLVPLIFLTYGFYANLTKRFGKTMTSIPLNVLHSEADLMSESNQKLASFKNESFMEDQETTPKGHGCVSYSMPCMCPPDPLPHETDPPMLDAEETFGEK